MYQFWIRIILKLNLEFQLFLVLITLKYVEKERPVSVGSLQQQKSELIYYTLFIHYSKSQNYFAYNSITFMTLQTIFCFKITKNTIRFRLHKAGRYFYLNLSKNVTLIGYFSKE